MSHPSVPLCVTLEPAEPFRSQVLTWKQRIRDAVGPQPFLDDPPHLTLYLAVFSDVPAACEAVTSLARTLEPQSAPAAGWHTFDTDPATGGHTVVFDLAAGAWQLRETQTRTVQELSRLRDMDATCQYYRPRKDLLRPDQWRAVENAGFPFVGPDWRPHVTLASLRPEVYATVMELLRAHTPTETVLFEAVSVSELVGRQMRRCLHLPFSS